MHGRLAFRRRPLAALFSLLAASTSTPLGASAPAAPLSAAHRDLGAWLSSRAGGGIGPPGGEVRALALGPGDASRLYAGTSNGHLYVSDDAAASWRESRAPLPPEAVVNRIAVDPVSPDLAFAAYWLPGGGGGLLGTRDGGRSWAAVPLPGNPVLRAVSIAPTEPSTVYAGGVTGIWRSRDRGETWTDVSGAPERLREIESIAVDPRSGSRIYAGTWRQAYRSLDAGETWTRLGKGMALDRDIFTIEFDPLEPDRLLAGTCGFLYVSGDAGGNWSVRVRGIPFDHRRIQSIAIAPSEPREVWAGTRGGLYRSRDGAASFDLAHGGVTVSAVALDRERSRVYAATEEMGVLVSHADGPFEELNAGLEASRIVAIEAMPGDPRTLFAVRSEGSVSQSIQTSRDGGRTWSSLDPALRFERVRFLRALRSPVPQLHVIASDGSWWRIGGGARLELLSAPPGVLRAVAASSERGLLLAATDEGLFAGSTNASSAAAEALRTSQPGIRWRRIGSGAMSAVEIAGERYLALGSGRALRGSLSDVLLGRPSEVVPTGLPDAVVAVALTKEKESTAYAITRRRVLVSEDIGSSWRLAALPWPARDLISVVVDPSDADRVVALDARGALFVGHGRGRFWRILDGDPRLDRAGDIRMTAAAPGLAMVATLGNGIRVVAVSPRVMEPADRIAEEAPKPPPPGRGGAAALPELRPVARESSPEAFSRSK